MPVSTSNSGRDLIVLGVAPRRKTSRKEEILASGHGRQWGFLEAFDMVLSVGGDYLEENVAYLKTDGKLVLYGLMGGTADPIDGGLLSKLLFRRISLLPSTLRSRSMDYKASMRAFGRTKSAATRRSSGAISRWTWSTLAIGRRPSSSWHHAQTGTWKIVLMVSNQTATLEWFSREMRQLEDHRHVPREGVVSGRGKEEIGW